MIRTWGYAETFIVITGAIRFYPDVWRNERFKWLSVNQVYTWIGAEAWKMYENKEYKVKVTYPKL